MWGERLSGLVLSVSWESLSASDAHCPGLAGSVPRLLGGKQVHARGSGPAAGEVQRAGPGRLPGAGGTDVVQRHLVGPFPAGLGTVLGDADSRCDVNIGFHFTVQSAPRGYFLLLFYFKNLVYVCTHYYISVFLKFI